LPNDPTSTDVPPEPPHRALEPSADEESGESRDPAIRALFDRVYSSLKGLAHQVRAGRAGETLNTTALVHEAFVKLSTAKVAGWKDEAHFFALAARAMRQILTDTARRELAAKRRGDAPMMSYDDSRHAASMRTEELLALDSALEQLAAIDTRRALVVEHRIFAGLSTVETARILRVSPATIEREWRAARAWLALEIGSADGGRAAAKNRE
jgi:RNA polymerase sigma factor (TIGR02999 family)